MMAVYDIAGISRQAHFKELHRLGHQELMKAAVVSLCDEIRRDHPVIGCRKMYDMIGSQLSIGRDRFESMLLDNGFRARVIRNYRRTTCPVTSGYFPNLIEGLEVRGIDQLWQTDLTYFFNQGRFYYLVFIIDVYSRRIIGHHVSDNMLAYSNICALRMAMATRGNPMAFPELIHHSDRGGQYINKEYVDLLRSRQIKPSMCLYPWENAYAERINGIIKNDYLTHRTMLDYRTLQRKLDRAVKLYNEQRPHNSLPGRVSPIRFEELLKQGLIQDYVITIHKPDKSTNPQPLKKKKVAKKK